MSRAPITAKGAQRLRAELEELKSVKRPAVIEAIAEARAHGDLKENAEYHAAREQQGFIEGRIKHLEGELSHAQVIDIATLTAGDRIVFGATVQLADVDTDEKFTPDTEVVSNGYFHESEKRSAPYFDVNIDGITLLNEG